MRRVISAMLVGGILCLMPAAALADDAPKNPPWCQKGYVCVPTDYLAERTARIYELRAELARTKARAARFGFAAGCGVGVASVVTQDWKVESSPAATCALIYGFRF